jgi:rhamnosyltransferase
MPTFVQEAADSVSPIESAIDPSHAAIIIPTYNARPCWEGFQAGLAAQGLRPEQILIIDSSSKDGTAELASDQGYQVVSIDTRDFNHGGTRQLALDFVPWAKFVIYLTQDAVLS